MSIDVYVVSLRQSADRRKRIEEHMAMCGVRFSFFDAVYGKEKKHEIFRLYDEDKRKLIRGKGLTLGQLGCFGSHMELWRLCAKKGDPVIVLEDDVVINAEEFLRFRDEASRLRPVGCIRLYKNKTRRNYSIKAGSIGSFDLLKYSKGPMGTYGYYIDPISARRFLDVMAPVIHPVDIFMDRFWSHQVEAFGVYPFCVRHDDEIESTIDGERELYRYGLWCRVRRELFNLSEKVRRFLWNARFRLTILSAGLR